MDKSESSGLDPEFAASLGRELRRIRQGRKESEELIARRLLLSVSQVKGIERGMHEPFYNPRHYVDAARRYARSMGVDFDSFEPSPAPEGEVEEPSSMLRKGVALKVGLSVAAVAGIAGVLALASYVSGGSGPAASGSGTVTTSVPVETSPSAQTPPAAAPVASPPVSAQAAPGAAAAPMAAAPMAAGSAPSPSGTTPASSTGPTALAGPTLSSAEKPPLEKSAAERSPAAKASPDKATAKPGSERPAEKSVRKAQTLKFTFSGTTWVQIVWRDGRRETRTFRARQTLALNRTELQAIIVGNPSHASVTAGSKRIDLSNYRQPGQREARIVGNRLRTLGG